MEIEPADCFQKARQLASVVEQIRREAGRPVETRPAVTVTGASPRECYFQALAVFRKADRLCQEYAGDPTAPAPYAAPIADLKPAHVLAVIDASLRELNEVARAVGAKEPVALPAREPGKTPSDVFGALATANRQINLLLERPFTPADCYQQVSLAIAYAARAGNVEPPALAPFERGKRPVDCYRRLAGCLDTTRALVKKAKQPVIDHGAPADDNALPSDVYDLATLVLAEVVHLHALHKDASPVYPFEANQPGRKLPSHVWQLAGVLERTLQQL